MVQPNKFLFREAIIADSPINVFFFPFFRDLERFLKKKKSHGRFIPTLRLFRHALHITIKGKSKVMLK